MLEPVRLLCLLLLVLTSYEPSAQNTNVFKIKEMPLSTRRSYVGIPNDSLLLYISKVAAKEPKYQPLLKKVKKIHALTLDFQQYVDDLRQRMVDESGGAYTLAEATTMGHPELEGRPKGKKDKDSPQRIFVTGDYGTVGTKEPQGEILAQKIKALRLSYFTIIESLLGNKEELEELKFAIKLKGEEGYDPKLHNEKSWSEFTFGYMPVAAIYPMLRKFQNDAKKAETAFLEFSINQMNGVDLSAEMRSYYALMEQLNNKVLNNSLVFDIEGFEKENPQYRKIATQIKKIKKHTLDFDTYVEELGEQLIQESGGVYTKEQAKAAGNTELIGKLKGRANKEVPHRIFVTGDDKNVPQGKVLVEKAKQLKADCIRLVGELWDDGGIEGTVFAMQDKKEEILELLASRIFLIYDQGNEQTAHKSKTWEENVFGNIPVAGIIFVLYHIQQDANQSEMTVMNFLISPLNNYK